MTMSVWILCGIGIGLLVLEAILFIVRKTYSKARQKQLRRAKEEAQEIAQIPLNNPHPLIQIDKSGAIIFANIAALQAFPDLQENQRHSAIDGVVEEGQREVACNNRIYHQTISQTPMKGEQTFIIYAYDITTQKQQEEVLKKAYSDTEKARIAAEKATEARGEFLANMSHELRTPMNGIIGLSDILVESGLGEKQHLIEAVNSSARGLLILLNDILDFSKIEAGELSIESISFSVRKTIDQIASLQKPMATKKGLYLTIQISEKVPAQIMGDPARLQQILNNLISNALKFTEIGGVNISINASPKGRDNYDLIIKVVDTGIGIPLDKQKAIFEKFQQADASTARKYGGTGLGLAITKQLTELMAGTIKIESQERKGTAFTITIPTKISDETEKKDHVVINGGVDHGVNLDSRILIVDDHPVNLLFLQNVLKRAGFKTIHEAGSGKEAIKSYRDHGYDLIFMDCQMPDMDGFETSRHIMRFVGTGKGPAIIAVTADAMKGAEEKCKAAGMHDYISKPVDQEKLVLILCKWVPGKDAFLTGKDVEDHEVKEVSESKSRKIFDGDRLAEFTGGDPDIEAKLKTIFIDNLKIDVQLMKDSLSNDNYEEWDACVHKIYGSASHIGAAKMAELCNKGQSLYPEHIDDIPQQHGLILQEYQYIHEHLQQYMTQ